jgi:acyl-CoA synthetase (AMP-forming)/AMP-acid ligase II
MSNGNRIKETARKVKLGQLGPLADAPFTLKVMSRAGIVRPMPPATTVKVLRALRTWGASPAAGITASGFRRPDRIGVIDERGQATFGELDARSNALARALRDEAGVKSGDSVAVMCRNHQGFIEAIYATAKLGATVLLMNTDFAGPQLVGVVEREEPKALIHDSEFVDLLEEAGKDLEQVVSWVDDDTPSGLTTAEELIGGTSTDPLEPPADPSRFIVLTSGTTGTPKGAQRKSPDSLGPLAALFDKIPLRSEQTIHIAAPMFHSWGFLHFLLGLALGSTYVLRRRFTPEGCLSAVAEHRTDALAVVPVMLQRIMELPEDVRSAYDLSHLRITAASGSALPGDLATRWMDSFGDNLYNLYGSTEVAWASIATPADMRAAPGTAGKPPHGTVVKIVDEDGKPVPHGDTGRIFVGNEMAFEGYTGGGTKDAVDGLMSSGDVGHFDDDGRLFIDGRDDEMIVSGGENVFPREVEDLLSDHDAIDEAAVIGVDDEKFGQRLKAFIVTSSGKDVSEDEVKGYIKENLARYKVPREVEFLDELPRNPTGKVLKRELVDKENGGGDEGDEGGG